MMKKILNIVEFNVSETKGLMIMMKIIVISSCAVIKEGILSAISKNENVLVGFTGETIKEAILMIRSKIADVMLLEIHEGNEFELEVINDIRTLGSPIKLILIDSRGSYKLFVKALKCGVQGYVLRTSNEEDIMYAIKQVYEGKKYYDPDYIDKFLYYQLSETL